MDPMDVPTEVTKLVYAAPRTEARSQNEVAELLAHYWPAIEKHVLLEAADRLTRKCGVTNRAAGDLRRMADETKGAE